MADRVQSVIDTLINPDQVAYIHNRFIGTNIRLISDVINKAENGLLFFLDFKKAFDSVEWNFITECLKHYNFGESLINWIKILYANPKVAVKNNGYISDVFDIHRGVRQGCPFSCLIFILCIEVLAESIRQNKNIRGIKLNTSHIKICQYADDATIFLQNETEFAKCIELIENFGKISGMQLNMSKCEGFWLGNNANLQDTCQIGGIKWPKTPIRCLGIYIGHNKDACNDLNWYSKVNKMEGILEIWKTRRNLTLFGKVQVIKCLAMSGLIYTATNCEIPSTDIIKDINKILYNFIWGKTERIKRNTLINDKCEGGINMIDVYSQFEALKASWVSRILHGDQMCHWKEIPLKQMNKLGDNLFILKTNINNIKMCPLLYNLSQFYQECVISFTKAKEIDEETFNESILDQPLFGNRFLKLKVNNTMSCLYYLNWIENDIKYVGNLRIQNGIIDETYLYENITRKVNIFAEISMIKKSLKPFLNGVTHNPTEIIDENIYQSNGNTIHDIDKKKSKFFYTCLINIKKERPFMEYKWNLKFQGENNFKKIYTRKVINIRVNKLAETNYKILLGILPCGTNLLRWKRKTNANCDVCNEIETIEHLLYECEYVKHIWQKIMELLDVEITLRDIILGSNLSDKHNFIVSVVVYLIYKEWVNLSLDTKVRQKVPNLLRYINELMYYKMICEKTIVLQDYIESLQCLCDGLM